jgi:hypothetical protein
LLTRANFAPISRQSRANLAFDINIRTTMRPREI